MSRKSDLPSSWAQYESGGRQASADSTGSRVAFDEEAHQHGSPSNGHQHASPGSHDLRHRRSSMAMRISSLRQAGGVNSFDAFAKSWQRAAGFPEVMGVRPSFLYHEGDDDGFEGTDEREYLREALANGRSESNAVFDEDDESAPASRAISGDRGDTLSTEQSPLLRQRSSRPRRESILEIEPQIASQFGGSYGTAWGSVASRAQEPSMRHAGRIFREQQIKEDEDDPDKERKPVFVKQVQGDDGEVVNVIVGQSTLPQTIFNSVNVLIGIGLLALPLALKMSGWIPGLIFLMFAGISTAYTAKLLAKCADVDNSLITFADLAFVSFGPWARLATSILFSLELLASCVALVVLFADSLDSLVPWGLTEWKIVCGIILLPLSFMPLRLLSYTSILGIVSCFGIVAAVFVDGLIKPDTPGSLRQPAVTYLFPSNWMTLPVALGILMSPFGGHSVFPSIYRDMRHPYKYRKAVNITYVFTVTLDLFMAIVGLLMFGDGVKDEITRNIFQEKGYPQWISLLIVICVAIIPLTKVPLNARPIVSTVEIMLGLDPRAIADSQSLTGLSGFTRGAMKIAVRVITTILFVILAILIPQFDTIMSLLGSIACFTVCIILPCAFHLKLFSKELTKYEKARDWTLLIISTILAVVSTAFNFVPKEKMGM